jgi:hypothetical protein
MLKQSATAAKEKGAGLATRALPANAPGDRHSAGMVGQCVLWPLTVLCGAATAAFRPSVTG